MDQVRPTQGVAPARRSIFGWAVTLLALAALALAVACNDSDGARAAIGSAGSSAAGGSAVGGSEAGGETASHAGADDAPLAGAAGSDSAGDAGAGGVTNDDAGAPGTSLGGVGAAGAPAAGAPAQVFTCLPGGAPLVVGNYRDTSGSQFLLRSAAKAETFALVPAGAPNPARPPRLFLVNRVCSGGNALLASEASSSYRVDYSQTGAQLAICISPPVATPEAAAALTPADVGRAADTGCAGKPFAVYTTEVQ